MYREPWAKFTTPRTPRINVSPEEMRNSSMLLATPLRSWVIKVDRGGSQARERNSSIFLPG
jgi:hypothetical protein